MSHNIWMTSVVILASLAGCIEGPEDDPSQDVALETNMRGLWWDEFVVDSHAPLNVCVPAGCLEQLGEPIAITQSNASILHFEASVTWGEEHISLQDREVTVSCRGGKSRCIGLERPLTISGPSPLLIEVPEMTALPNATLFIDVQIPDWTPDPIKSNLDASNAFRLKGTLLFQSMTAE